MANVEAPLLLLFDLDDTLILTSGIKKLRDSRKWAEVYRSFSMTTLPPGTLGFIAKWGKNASLGVVTNSPRTYAERLLRYHGMSIPVLAAYRDTRQHKPHPAPILHALGKTAMTTTDCIYIGDLVEDVLAGKAAGVATVLVSWIRRVSSLPSDGSVCTSWQEVSSAIEKVASQRCRKEAT